MPSSLTRMAYSSSTRSIVPSPYFGDNQTALDLALESIPELIGEFEKPKYFSYDPGICAHGRSGIPGCTRCIEACPTDAIISIGETIEVNPHLCQGGGSCTASCPTGAITYNYPQANEQHDFVRKALSTIRELGDDTGTTLLIFDNEHGREAIEAAAPGFADHIFPLVVEEIGSVGLDLVATSLTYGASQVVLFVPAEVPEQVQATLTFNLSVVNAVLDQSGGDTYLATMIRTAEELDSLAVPVRPDAIATFAAIGNKRNTIRTAFNWLAENGNNEQDSIALPEGALFGTVHTQAEGCTLCMGCVAVCPGNALQAGGDTPALRFIEANCVQCGICSRACPESVITLESRLHLDHDTVQRARTLKEEEPFRCITCSKPFATKAMIARMTEKLKGHWMFDKPDAINRLQMCEDCRVKDMFDKEGSLEQ